MKNSGRNTAHQRKIYLTVLIIIIILGAVFVGVYYLWKQTKTESEMKVSGQAERSQTQNDADTIEYQGSTYKYNDHLSNYLFMGIDTRENVDTYESQKDAGQADSIFLVSMDRATEQLKVLFIPRDSMTIASLSSFVVSEIKYIFLPLYTICTSHTLLRTIK